MNIDRKTLKEGIEEIFNGMQKEILLEMQKANKSIDKAITKVILVFVLLEVLFAFLLFWLR